MIFLMQHVSQLALHASVESCLQSMQLLVGNALLKLAVYRMALAVLAEHIGCCDCCCGGSFCSCSLSQALRARTPVIMGWNHVATMLPVYAPEPSLDFCGEAVLTF
ncbi:TPA: hypothetical protein ACH3X2_006465 [Trebouxia sp. C0005]